MGANIRGAVGSILATGAIPPKRFVGLTGAVCGAGAKAIGVSINDTASAEQCAVAMDGIELVQSGAGGVAVGDYVKSDATGRAVTSAAVASGAAIGIGTLGVALDAASGADEFIRIKLL